jgi:uncharacterized protein
VETRAIIFALHNVVVPGGRWSRARIADVPHPGERIRRGHPICTVLADAADAAGCLRALTTAAAGIYRALETRAPGAA